MRSNKTDKQVADVEQAAYERAWEGGSEYPDLTYEKGVADALDWVRGLNEELEEKFPFDKAKK